MIKSVKYQIDVRILKKMQCNHGEPRQLVPSPIFVDIKSRNEINESRDPLCAVVITIRGEGRTLVECSIFHYDFHPFSN